MQLDQSCMMPIFPRNSKLESSNDLMNLKGVVEAHFRQHLSFSLHSSSESLLLIMFILHKLCYNLEMQYSYKIIKNTGEVIVKYLWYKVLDSIS